MTDINHDGYMDLPVIFDEELIEIGYSDTKIKFDIGSEVEKSMIKIFGFDIQNDYDYFLYKKNIKKTATVVDPNKPGLATIFKQTVLTIGDMVGFLFKLVKQSIEQLINSFIMPILTPAVPYTLPIIIQNIIKMVTKIVDMVKEAISIATKTKEWLLEKVGGKILKVNIPIPEFKIPILGLAVVVPAIDNLKLLKTEPLSNLPTDKIKNLKSQIEKINKNISQISPNQISKKNELTSKKKDIENEIKKLEKINNNDVKKLSNELNELDYEIEHLRDSKSDNNKNYMENSLKVMEVCLDTLKRSLFELTYDTVKLIIEVHNEVIMKKKQHLDDFLTLYINDKKNINNISTIGGKFLFDINTNLTNSGFTIDNLSKHIEYKVVKGNTNDINSDTNYIIRVDTLPIKGNDHIGYISYKFKNRIDIFQSDFNILNNNRKVVIEYKTNGRKTKLYKFTGDFEYLKKVTGRLIDELEKEELDIEEDINIFKVENVPSINDKIKLLDDLLNKPYIKKLKKEDYIKYPKFSDTEKRNLKKLNQQIPQQDVDVKEILVSGYTSRILNNKQTIDEIIIKINELEKTIIDFKKRKNEYTSTSLDKKLVDSKIKELEVKKNNKKKELIDKSPQSIFQNTLIKLLMGIIAFPIQIIVGLISSLMEGIIDFITSLPLLNFEKITEFFTNLVQLPDPNNMSKSMGKMITEITNAPIEFTEPITNIVSTLPSVVTNVTSGFVEEQFKDILPFDIPIPKYDLESIGLPIDQSEEIIQQEYTSNPSEKPVSEKQSSSKAYQHSRGKSQFGLISQLHPLVRTEFTEIYNKLNNDLKDYNIQFRLKMTYRSSEYQEELYRIFTTDKKEAARRGILAAAKPGKSFHEYGLAFDAYFVEYNKKNKSSTKMDDGKKYAINLLKNYGWYQPVPSDYVHWEKHTIIGKNYATASNFPKDKTYEGDGLVYPKLA